MAKINFKIEGMAKLQRDIKKLGKVPQKHVTSSARKGMNVVLRGARANAPYDTGALKKGMKLQGERSKYKGKKVYKIVFDDKMNHVFQKPIKKPGSRGGKGHKKGYYPVAQEYGYFAGKGNYIPGYRFIHKSLEGNARKMEKTIVDSMKQKIDTELRKAGLK